MRSGGASNHLTLSEKRSPRPRKSIRLLQRAGFEVLHALQAGEPHRTAVVTAEDIARTFAEMTDTPLDQLRENADAASDYLTRSLNTKIRGRRTRLLRLHLGFEYKPTDG